MNEATTRHPRLLFSTDELTVLRREATRGTRGRVLARVAELCAGMMTPGDPNYLDFRERTSDTWKYRHGIFRVVPSLACLATGYAFTGDAAIGDCARDAVMAIVEHGLADVHSLSYGGIARGWRHGEGHDKGKFAQALAWVYDFCHDRFTSAQCRRVGDYARECMDIAESAYEGDVRQGANNRGVRGVLGNTWLYLAFEGEGDLEGYKKWLDRGEIALDKYLIFGHDADGAPNEGVGYASGCLAYMAAVAWAMRRRGLPDYLTYPVFERYQHYLACELLPGGGTANNLNDCRLPCGSILGCLPLMGSERGALLPWLGAQLDFHPQQADTWLTGQDLTIGHLDNRFLLHYLLWWRDDIPVRTPVELGFPRAHCFREHGIASMRTGWGEDDRLLTHACGRKEHNCHHQGDNNHVTLYAGGEHVLVDAGYGLPFKDPTQPVDRWFGLTAAHNCVLIDGDNQRGWAHGRMLEFRHTESFVTSLGDASAGVGPNHQVRRALRRVVSVPRGPAAGVVIIDLNEKDGKPFEAAALWHTHPDNRIEIDADGRGFIIHGRHSDWGARVLWPADTELRLEDDHGRPCVRVRVEARVAETVTVFAPRAAAAEIECERTGPGAFRLRFERDGEVATMRASAAIRGPLGMPLPVTLRAVT